MPKTYRNDPAYVRKREALKRQCRRNNTPCAYCGKPFNWELEGTKNYWKHPQSFTANHITAVANGGSMTGDLEPMHRACNSRLGKKDRSTLTKPAQPRTSRQW